jgi:NAD+ synthase
MKFSKDAIKINPVSETEKIVLQLKSELINTLRKKGAVIGLSGGVDSSVVLALCVKALGNKKVIALMLPEKDSSPESLRLAKNVADKFGVSYFVENLTESLRALGCYKRRDDAVKRIFPEYDDKYKMKITVSKDDEDKGVLNLFNLSIISPDGEEKIKRLPATEFLQIVAASNLKQRCRMSILYYYAEKNNYCVTGTGNKNEYRQGFFVKNGDGGVDIMPIGHLYKSQVYQLAEYLGIPEEILRRTPTSDTYSAEQTQTEFFFKVPFEILDPIALGMEMEIPVEMIAEALELDLIFVKNVVNDLRNKIRTTEYLRYPPIIF